MAINDLLKILTDQIHLEMVKIKVFCPRETSPTSLKNTSLFPCCFQTEYEIIIFLNATKCDKYTSHMLQYYGVII